MATLKVKVCDVAGCRLLADETLPMAVIAHRDDQGLHLLTLPNIDFCGKHEYEYRTAVPQMRIKTPELGDN